MSYTDTPAITFWHLDITPALKQSIHNAAKDLGIGLGEFHLRAVRKALDELQKDKPKNPNARFKPGPARVSLTPKQKIEREKARIERRLAAGAERRAKKLAAKALAKGEAVKPVPEVRRKGGRPRLNLTPEQMAERYERRLEVQRAYDARQRAKKLAAEAPPEPPVQIPPVQAKLGLAPAQQVEAEKRERRLAQMRESNQRRRAAKWAAYEKYAQMGAEA